jgi:hypothetical protein
MKFMVTIERDEEGIWVVECPSIPGCVSRGTKKEEALNEGSFLVSVQVLPKGASSDMVFARWKHET